MEKFIDYFWKSKGFVYDPNKEFFLTSYHVLMLISIVGLFVLLMHLLRNKTKETSVHVLRISGLVLFILEGLRYLNYLFVGQISWIGSFSFHICSIGIYIAIMAGLFQKKWLFDAFLIHALIGAPLALLIPNGVLAWYHPYSFMPIQSFISHGIFLFILVFSHQKGIWEPKLKNYYRSIVSLLLSTLVAYLMSMVNLSKQTGGHQNFFWTRYPDPAFPLIGQMNFPYYLLIMLATMIGVGFLYPLLTKLLSKKAKKQ